MYYTYPGLNRLANDTGRSPSTSPPACRPEESFMIDGLEQDDRYRMVEDEFVQVAGTFTAHLHAAEYQRLKQIAKSQNADTILNISRPVTGRMIDAVKRRSGALHRISKQRAGIKRALGGKYHEDASDNDGELPWAGTSLHGLMESSPTRPAVRLSAIAPSMSNTRAAAGYSENLERQSSPVLRQYEVEDFDHKDMAQQPRSIGPPDSSDGGRRPGTTKSRHPTTATNAIQTRQPALSSSGVSSVTQLPPSRRKRSSIGAGDTAEDNDSLSDGLDGVDFLRRARERRAREKIKRSLS